MTLLEAFQTATLCDGLSTTATTADGQEVGFTVRLIHKQRTAAVTTRGTALADKVKAEASIAGWHAVFGMRISDTVCDLYVQD